MNADAAKERKELEVIVRALAKYPDVVDDQHHCGICGAYVDTDFNDITDHYPDCPRRRTVEWCQKHPEVK